MTISFAGRPSSKPLLISLKHLSEPPSPSNDRHLLVVGKVVDALSNTDQMEEQLEDQGADDSNSLRKPDDNMVLY